MIVVRLFVAVACVCATGCASALRFSIVGEANELGAVDEQYGAARVELSMTSSPGVSAEFNPGAADDATRRLSSMLPAAGNAPEAPPTRMEVQYLATDKSTVKVKLVTSVHGEDVVTEEESADLAESGDRALYTGSSISSYVAVGIGSVFTAIASGALALGALPCALVSLVGAGACLVAAVPGLIVQSVSLNSMEKSIQARGSQFIGDVLRKHAQRIRSPAGRVPGQLLENREDARAPSPSGAGDKKSAPPSAPVAQEQAVWFVGVDGQPRGPMTASEVHALQKKGAVTYDSLVWKDGMQWTPLRDVKELWSPDIPPPVPKAKGSK